MINCYINSVGFRIFSGFSLSFESLTRLFIDVQKTILYFNCFFFFVKKLVMLCLDAHNKNSDIIIMKLPFSFY